jgi:hypothetical protein
MLLLDFWRKSRITIETNRLIIRNFRVDDWQDLQDLAVHYRAVMAFLFEQSGIDAILTGARLENTPSVKLLGRLGLHPIGQGEFRISKEEWRMG